MDTIIEVKGSVQKSELIDEIYKKQNGSILKKEIDFVIDTFLESMIDHLSSGDKVTLSGFGSFEVRKRSKRIGTNPRTKQKMIVPEQKNIYFKSGKKLKAKTNADVINYMIDED